MLKQETAGSRRWFWILFGVAVFVGTSLFFIPTFVIRPFRYQSPKALVVAVALRSHAPLWTLVAAVVVVVLVLWQWQRVRWGARTILIVCAVLVVGSAAMARMNYFEWMFHPVAQPGFQPAEQTKLDDGEMVLTVTFNNDARAYPIREMGYHHIVNDVVGGVPVAVTY